MLAYLFQLFGLCVFYFLYFGFCFRDILMLRYQTPELTVFQFKGPEFPRKEHEFRNVRVLSLRFRSSNIPRFLTKIWDNASFGRLFVLI